MDIRWVSATETRKLREEEIEGFSGRDGGFLWLDVPRCDNRSAQALTRAFAIHPLAIRDCQEGTSVPKFHVYNDHVFLALHTLRRVGAGTLEPIQFNLFIGRNFLTTVHGPVSQHANYSLGIDETRMVAERVDRGRWQPETPLAVAANVISGQVRVLEDLVTEIAENVLSFERRTANDALSDVDAVLDGMFRLRLDLGVIRATAFNGRQLAERMQARQPSAADSVEFLAEMRDQYERVIARCDSEKELLQDVLDFYQTRLTNDLNTILKRFTSIGAILVACTLISGIYGMNFEHMPELSWRLGYPLAMAAMAILATGLALLFRRKRWL